MIFLCLRFYIYDEYDFDQHFLLAKANTLQKDLKSKNIDTEIKCKKYYKLVNLIENGEITEYNTE